MRAILEVRADKEETFQTVKRKGFFGGSEQVPGPPKITGYTVVLAIEFTEEEKAIVTAYQLQAVVLYDEPLYSSEDMQQRAEELQHAFRKLDNADKLVRETITDMRASRMEWHFGDFASHTKAFSTPHYAYSYANFLKSKILPDMKNLLGQYHDRPAREVIEL